MHRILLNGVLAILCPTLFAATIDPLVRTVDMNIGDATTIQLSDGSKARLKLLNLAEQLDSVTAAVRRAVVTVEVNGMRSELVSGTYNLPREIGGVQIDCSVTKGYLAKGSPGSFGLKRMPGSGCGRKVRRGFVRTHLPIPQNKDGSRQTRKWPTIRSTWTAANGRPRRRCITTPVSTSAAAKVWSKSYPLSTGWWFQQPVKRYPSTDATLRSVPATTSCTCSMIAVGAIATVISRRSIRTSNQGVRVKQGQRLGHFGKEGGSGGWTHLHFEAKGRQPSGEWGTQEGYAFLWQAYLAEHKPRVIAVARPHHLLWTGESVTLDASKSWADGKIAKYAWTFGDGTMAKGKQVKRTYSTPGRHSEILKVTDTDGNVSYDFAVVIVYDRDHPERHVTTVHPNYHPTSGIRVGDPVTFKVRSFISGQSREGYEVWNFGDGSSPVKVRSDGNAVKLAPDGYAEHVHRFEKAGNYVVRVQRKNEFGVVATGHLWVHVLPK